MDRRSAYRISQAISRIQQPSDPDLLSLKTQHNLTVCPFPEAFSHHFRSISQEPPCPRHTSG